MSILLTTQSYQRGAPTEHGLLIELDERTGEGVRQVRVDTPVTAPDGAGRIKSGLRGLCRYREKLYVAAWNKVIVLDEKRLAVEREISHAWMSDLHGIHVDHSGLWVNSSLPDALILYSFDGRPISSVWFPETSLYKKRSVVDKGQDWRCIGKTFRGFREFHNNHVSARGGRVYITGRGKGRNRGRIVSVSKSVFLEKERLDNSDLRVFSRKLFGPHDGVWNHKYLWITETNGSSVAKINADGKLLHRKQIKTPHDGRGSSLFKRMRRSVAKRWLGHPGDKATHWTRGMAFTKDHLYVGQSTWAEDSRSRARIAKVDRNSLELCDCFYLDLPDYPEPRIFQLLTAESPSQA